MSAFSSLMNSARLGSLLYEEDQNGLYGGNSNADDCVSKVQSGDEVEP